jgi:hypothetical protein
MPRTLRAVVLLFVVPGSEAAAQSAPDLEVGSRVRLMAAAVSPKQLIGTILRLDATTLELQMADQKQATVVPRDAITRAEISLGWSKKRHVLIGALVGGAVGTIAVLATPEEPCDPIALGSDLLPCVAPGPSQGEGALILGAVGAATGALVGSLIPPGERWQTTTARPRMSIGPTHGRGVQISLSLSF